MLKLGSNLSVSEIQDDFCVCEATVTPQVPMPGVTLELNIVMLLWYHFNNIAQNLSSAVIARHLNKSSSLGCYLGPDTRVKWHPLQNT